jgi:toxin YoeB
MGFRLVFTQKAHKDSKKLEKAGENLKQKAIELLRIIKENPYKSPPSFEKLTGDLTGMYSRRINIQHRLVYEVIDKEKIVKVLSMYSHYE